MLCLAFLILILRISKMEIIMYVDLKSQVSSIYQHTLNKVTPNPTQKTEISHSNKNADTVTISAAAQNAYKNDAVQWANDKYKQDLKQFKEHIDSNGVAFAQEWSDGDIMKHAQGAAYQQNLVPILPRELSNGDVEFYYPDGSSPFNSDFPQQYTEKWAGLREERISEFERMKSEGSTPLKILTAMQKMSAQYVAAVNMEV